VEAPRIHGELPKLGIAIGYYHQARTHLALDKDAPHLRPIQILAAGRIVQLPEVGRLHHRYARQAA
jgi:hypothetical protein